MPVEIPWTAQAPFPILSSLIVLPLLGMAAEFIVHSRRQVLFIGILVAGLELLLAAYLLYAFDIRSTQLQFAENYQLLPFLNVHLGIDGFNILFIAATALLGLLLILYGEVAHERSSTLYVASIFVFQSILMGLFESVNLLQFWLLSGLELLPATLILKRWGTHRDKDQSLVIYLQFMGSGLLMVFIGLILLGWQHARTAGFWSFEPHDLGETPLPSTLQSVVFIMILYGLAVRMAQFPFHAWLPETSRYGTYATLSVLLVGTKVGIYGIFRFLLPLLPEAAHFFKSTITILATIGMFYGAIQAMMQLNLRRLLAFAVISQTGMLIIGAFSLNREGLAGTLLLSINFGLAASGLLFSTGLLLRRAGSALLPRLGGLFDEMPLLGITFLISALSTMAMPGTPGFDAAHLLLEGAIETHHWGVAIAVAAGNVMAAAFLLWAFQRVFLAQRRETAIRLIPVRLNIPEAVLTGIICAVLLWGGFYIEPWLELIDRSVGGLAERLAAAQP